MKAKSKPEARCQYVYTGKEHRGLASEVGEKCRESKEAHGLNRHDQIWTHKFIAPKKPKAKPRAKEVESDLDIGFDRGILAALYIVDYCDRGDSSRIYHEIAKSNDPKDLWAKAGKQDREHLKRHGFGPSPVQFIRKGK
jgi:hypothetical protein